MLTKNDYIPPALLDTLDEMRRWIRKLPEKPIIPGAGTTLWPIASLVRATKIRFELRDWVVMDGFYMNEAYGHSWLQKELPDQMYLVLDIYPPQSWGGPIVFLHRHRPEGYIYLDRMRLLFPLEDTVGQDVATILEIPYSG